jgi:hypothetical protein
LAVVGAICCSPLDKYVVSPWNRVSVEDQYND